MNASDTITIQSLGEKKNTPLSHACSPAALQPPAPPWLRCLSSVPDPSVPDLDLGPEASPAASGCSRPGRPASASESQFSSPSPPWFSSVETAPWPAAHALTAAERYFPLMDPEEEMRRSRHTQVPGRGCRAGVN